MFYYFRRIRIDPKSFESTSPLSIVDIRLYSADDHKTVEKERAVDIFIAFLGEGALYSFTRSLVSL